MTSLYYKSFDTKLGTLLFGRTDQGLCLIDTLQVEEIKNWTWFNKLFKASDLVEDQTDTLDQAFLQIQDYLVGKRKAFDLKLDLIGSPFQLAVWCALTAIPFGQSISYGELACLMGKDVKSALAVGQAVGMNPLMIVVPCHRVLGQGQNLTGFRGGIKMKAALLDIEHIAYKSYK